MIALSDCLFFLNVEKRAWLVGELQFVEVLILFLKQVTVPVFKLPSDFIPYAHAFTHHARL